MERAAQEDFRHVFRERIAVRPDLIERDEQVSPLRAADVPLKILKIS